MIKRGGRERERGSITFITLLFQIKQRREKNSKREREWGAVLGCTFGVVTKTTLLFNSGQNKVPITTVA